jgi:hypothetical protein
MVTAICAHLCNHKCRFVSISDTDACPTPGHDYPQCPCFIHAHSSTSRSTGQIFLAGGSSIHHPRKVDTNKIVQLEQTIFGASSGVCRKALNANPVNSCHRLNWQSDTWTLPIPIQTHNLSTILTTFKASILLTQIIHHPRKVQLANRRVINVCHRVLNANTVTSCHRLIRQWHKVSPKSQHQSKHHHQSFLHLSN